MVLNATTGKRLLSLGKGMKSVEEGRMIAWQEMEDICKHREIVQALVTQVVKGGVVANTNGLRGFIPASQISIQDEPDLHKYVGKTFDVIPLEIDVFKQRLVLSRRAVLEEKQKEDKKRQNEEKRNCLRSAGDRIPFVLDKLLPTGEKILSVLAIDKYTKLYATGNYLFVVDEFGMEEIFLRRQIVHITFHLLDEFDDDCNEWYGDDDNNLAFDIFDTSGHRWRFYVSEDLLSNVDDFIKTLLTVEAQTSFPATHPTTKGSTSAQSPPNRHDDDVWN